MTIRKETKARWLLRIYNLTSVSHQIGFIWPTKTNLGDRTKSKFTRNRIEASLLPQSISNRRVLLAVLNATNTISEIKSVPSDDHSDCSFSFHFSREKRQHSSIMERVFDGGCLRLVISRRGVRAIQRTFTAPILTVESHDASILEEAISPFLPHILSG